MDIHDFLKILNKRRGAVSAIVGIFVLIGLIATFIQPLKYQASSRLLIIQQNASSDFYTITKSNQYLGSLLAETASSGSFYDLVSAANPNVNWGYFGGTYKQQIEKWKQTITASNSSDAAIIQIDIYHPDPEQARQISLAVDNLLISQNGLYQNSGDNIKLKIIDQPIVSSFPVKPNILVNLGVALIFGLLFGTIYVYYVPESRKEKRKKILAASRAAAPDSPYEHLPYEQTISYHPNRNRIPVESHEAENEREEMPSDFKRPEENSRPLSGNIRNIVS